MGLALWGWFKPKAPAGFLRVHMESQPGTLDITKATGRRENQVIRAISEGLVREDPETLAPLPGVAKAWTVSEDQKTYTFYLRDDARWTSGKPVTAQNFWDAWERILNPKTGAVYGYLLYSLQNGEAYAKGRLSDPARLGMEVVNPRTFKVTLERPNPYFLNLTSFPTFYPWNKEDPAQTNGPFYFDAWEADKKILLKPNPHYWDKAQVRLPGVEFLFFNNFNVALQHYDTKGIDVLNDLPPDQIPILKWRQDFHGSPVVKTDYFSLNVRKAPLDNPKFRAALAAAIDREVLANKILRRGDLPYGSFIPPKMPGYPADLHPQKFDPERAKHLLEEAGFGEGEPLPVLEIHCVDATDRLLVVGEIQKMWQKNLGLETRLIAVPWSDFSKARKEGRFQMSWGAWYADYLDPMTFLELLQSKNAQNYTGWSNPDYDALLHEAAHEVLSSSRTELFSQAEMLLLREAPIIPVMVKAQNALVRPYVKGYYSNLLDLHPLRDVYLSEH